MQTIVPYLTVKSAADAIEFYKKAFGAKENSRAAAQDGKRLMHADLSINGGSIFLMDVFPEHGKQGIEAPTQERPSPTSVVVNYGAPAEIDSAFRRAIEAGCKPVMEPQDTFWGARFAAVGDPFGHQWMLNATLPQKS
jgi:PhnB protein